MGLFYNKYTRLTLFLLIGVLFVSVKGCASDYMETSYGFPTVHLVYANYRMYYDQKILERGSFSLLKDLPMNLMINFLFIIVIWASIEKLRSFINPKRLKIFDKSYGLVLWYVALMSILMSNNTISEIFEALYGQFLMFPSTYLGVLVFGVSSYFGLWKFVDGEFILPSSLNKYYSDSSDLIVRVGLFLFMMLLFLLLFIILSIAQERKLKKRN